MIMLIYQIVLKNSARDHNKKKQSKLHLYNNN